MEDNLEILKDELEMVCLRFNCAQEEALLKAKEMESLFNRKHYLLQEIQRLENE